MVPESGPRGGVEAVWAWRRELVMRRRIGRVQGVGRIAKPQLERATTGARKVTQGGIERGKLNLLRNGNSFWWG
jgi:hypothetical protein